MARFLCKPMTCLMAFAVALTALLWAYLLVGLSASMAFESLASIGWAVLLVLWVVADARHRRQVPCFDFGLFVALTFPLSVGWYCLWSRGWRGLGVLVALFALWLAPYLAAMALWLVLYGH